MTARLVLALDTATDGSSVALLEVSAESVALVAERRGTGTRSESRRTLALVDELLAMKAAAPADLAAVVVGIGPGTFTGMRVGVATARALGLALGAPVVGISTLAAVASAALEQTNDEVVVPWVDARRGEVFAAVYQQVPAGGETGSRGLWRRVGEPFTVAPDRLQEVVMVRAGRNGTPAGGPEGGRAAALVRGQERLLEPGEGPAGARLLPWLRACWRAEGSAARRPPVPGAWGSPESVTPVYVRAPDADIHITKMRDPWA
ncbi:MAG: tRNA (adenosine(37)-N6)-threonylcarbamoyltransferase complex dimerization subunit type 1 TsaB [Thermoleophilia bacterium]|nr:tRNA (adenosine(37)-N6)-threonylcarbamoyltransferase complex dimerization subunit type 1 TsaB [Thermoleophilia bacterium]